MTRIAVHPKKYFEEYRNKHWNKKHKGMRKDFRGMTQTRFQSKNGVME